MSTKIRDESSETWMKFIPALAGAPFFIYFYVQGDPGRGMVAEIFTILFFVAIRFYWHLRDRLWFVMTIAVLVAVHVALVWLIPWVDTGYSGIVLTPIALPDFFLIYGIIKLVGKLVGEPNLDEPESAD